MNIPPITPSPELRDQVLLDYLTASSGSVEAARGVMDGNPATGAPGMSEEAKAQSYQLVRAALIDAELKSRNLVGRLVFVRQGSVSLPGRNVGAAVASLAHVQGSLPMRITDISKGRLVLQPINLSLELPADAVEGLIQ